MQRIITPQEFAQIRRLREQELNEGKKPTLEDKLFEQNEVSAVLQVPYDDIQLLDDFELQERIGRGSFSEVFRALDSENQERAIKEFRLATGIKSVSDYEKNREMFQRELKLYRSLSEHPQIPDFHGIAARLTRDTKRFREFQPAIVMEYVAGRDLLERLQKKDISPEEIRDVLMQVRSPLQALHHGNSQPRYHRDIKPANLKVNPEGTLYLLDFGSIRDELIGTYGGTLQVGSLGYAHKKQLDGEPSFRTDLYSLGRTLYALAIGKDLRDRDKFSRDKLDQTNLDSQLKDAIEMLSDPNLNGVQNVAELSDYLDRTPVVLEDVVAEVPQLASISTTDDNMGMILGRPKEPKEITSFYEGLSDDDISVMKKGLLLTVFTELAYWHDINSPVVDSHLRKSKFVDNPYDLTDPRHFELDCLRRGFKGAPADKYVRLHEFGDRGLTPENIKARNKHEKLLRRQFKKGLRKLLEHSQSNFADKLIDYGTNSSRHFLDYLNARNLVMFQSEAQSNRTNDIGFFFKRITNDGKGWFEKRTAFELTEEEQKAYSKLPLTTDTVNFLKEETENYQSRLSKIKERNLGLSEGTIDDVVEAELVDEDRDRKILLNQIDSCNKELVSNKLKLYSSLYVGTAGLIATLGMSDSALSVIPAVIGLSCAWWGMSLAVARSTYKKDMKRLETQLAKQLPAPEGEQALEEKVEVRGRLGMLWDKTGYKTPLVKYYFDSLENLENIAEREGHSEADFEERITRLERLRTNTTFAKRHADYDKLRVKNRKNRIKFLERRFEDRNYFASDIFGKLKEYSELSKLEGGEEADLNLYLKRWKMRELIDNTPIRKKYDAYSSRIKELPFSPQIKENIKAAFYAAYDGNLSEVMSYFEPIEEEVKNFPEIIKMIDELSIFRRLDDS
ncbi:MAG: serine/threonine-protein kinase [archaeon]